LWKSVLLSSIILNGGKLIVSRNKRKQKRIKDLSNLVICMAALLVVILIFKVVGNLSGSHSDKSANVQTAEESESTVSETVWQSENADENTAQEETEPEQPTKQLVENAVIPDVEDLSSTSIGYGHGNNVDENNRPCGASSYQEEYGDTYSSIFIKDADSKTIYLTFDEGYEYGFTDSILDTLKEKNVKAVFFVTKPYARSQADKVQRIIGEGHTLGNHSVTHPSSGLPSLSIEQQTEEVMENHRYIEENFGYSMHYFRFPAGIFSEQSLAIVNNCNYTSVFWSFAYYDYDVNNQPDQTASLQKLMNKLHPGAVYLLHAESETNTAILGQFIDQARAEGYEFAQLK
jgi:delta-lactam-biosynthetic de-N-acetylase